MGVGQDREREGEGGIEMALLRLSSFDFCCSRFLFGGLRGLLRSMVAGHSASAKQRLFFASRAMDDAQG